jgi:Ca2+-binding RTX toxin-like protein
VIQNIIKGVGDDLLTGSGANNSLSGGGGNDTLNGGAGNDTLDGGAGNDSLVGGTGNDLYVVDSTSDIIVENASEGTDIVQSSATYTIASNVENMTLTGTAAINGSGNTQDNVLIGNNGNNLLSGGVGNDTLDGNGGNDTLKGGAGNDTYRVSAGDGIDSIQESDNTAGNTDTLSFDSSVIKANIAMFMSGNDLQIGYKGDTTDQTTVVGQQTSTGSVERFQLSDGSFLTNADVNSVIQAMSSYAVSHGASFTSLSDVENNSGLLSLVSSAWHY